MKKEVISCIISEIENRKDELTGELIKTIYFGGGTPSLLDQQEIMVILKNISLNYKVDSSAEISFEANPDNLKPDYLKMLKGNGINRLSIGIQSFNEKDLELMRRSHTAAQAIKALRDSIRLGFNNINVDLIYGIPGQNTDTWEKNIDTVIGSGIQHISAYHLTFEPGTVFDHWKKKEKISQVDEEISLQHFDLLIKKSHSAGFEHYEISNFALEGFQSKHNSNYWKQVNYLGFGPSAHSYNENVRRWNVSNNLRYVESLQNNQNTYFEFENLSRTDLYNEYILKSLRTKSGINIAEVAIRFGEEYKAYVEQEVDNFINTKKLIKNDEIITLSRQGIFIADYIITRLFKI